MNLKNKKKVKLAILGCGVVGASLVELVSQEFAHGIGFEIAGIGVANLKKKRPPHINRKLLTSDLQGLVENPEIDIVVEVMGGLDPAYPLLVKALKQKKVVVTANKELLAHKYADLISLAKTNKTQIYFEAAVAGGIPIIRVLRESLALEKISRLMGIINGTTNFILSEMTSKKVSFEQALSTAKKLGFAESDPSSDISGKDAAFKCAILASLITGQEVKFNDVSYAGIEEITQFDIEFAKKKGFEIKLLAIVEIDRKKGLSGHRVSARVTPAMIPINHPLSATQGAYNAIFIEGDNLGRLMLYGPGAGGKPTATAVLGDIVKAGLTQDSMLFETQGKAKVIPSRELYSSFYVSIDVLDRPGVLALVALAFGRNKVSIWQMEQLGTGENAKLVFLTHEAPNSAIEKTLKDLKSLKPVIAIGSVLRIEAGN